LGGTAVVEVTAVVVDEEVVVVGVVV